MRLGRRISSNQEAHIDLTPMLDIVFIILIFFIVSSSFLRESAIEVNQPKANNTSTQKETDLVITITASNDIVINKRIIDAERVEETLASLREENPTLSLLIQADEYAYNGTVVKVMDAAKSVSIDAISLSAEKP